MSDLRVEIADAIGIKLPVPSFAVEYQVVSSTKEEGYTRQYITYISGKDTISAYLLLPDVLKNNPAVMIHHQHNREHHLGKSEVCGLAGNPLQAFGPALAKRGFVVLAADSICFEERRKDPSMEGFDFWQHFNEMCYRILKGEYLMKKVLEDAMTGISLLMGLSYVDKKRIGTMGHSYGGNTVLFLSALDERIAFSCASGSACTYENRMQNDVGIEMASVIPDFYPRFDIPDLVSCTAPRRLLIVSAEEDKYSRDAAYIVEKAGEAYRRQGTLENLFHKRYPGGHALTQERVEDMIAWMEKSAGKII